MPSAHSASPTMKWFLCPRSFLMEFVTNMVTSWRSSSRIISPRYPTRFSGKPAVAISFTHSICPKCVGYPSMCMYMSFATLRWRRMLILPERRADRRGFLGDQRALLRAGLALAHGANQLLEVTDERGVGVGGIGWAAQRSASWSRVQTVLRRVVLLGGNLERPLVP